MIVRQDDNAGEMHGVILACYGQEEGWDTTVCTRIVHGICNTVCIEVIVQAFITL
jgi:hypothetical protein